MRIFTEKSSVAMYVNYIGYKYRIWTKVILIIFPVLLLLNCQTDDNGNSAATTIKSVEVKTMDGNSQQEITIYTDNHYPVVTRNLDCGAAPLGVLDDPDIEIDQSTKDHWEQMDAPLELIEVDYDAQTVVFRLTASDGARLLEDETYRFHLLLPDGSDITWSSTVTPDNATDDDSDTDTDTDNDSDSGIISTDSQFESTDSSDSANDDSETDDAQGKRLYIEAECAFGTDMGNCHDSFEGTHSTDVTDPYSNDYAPACDAECQVVTYMCTGAWIAFPGIDFSGFTRLTVRVSSYNEAGNLRFVADYQSPGQTDLGFLNIYTGAWLTFEEHTIVFNPLNGVHTLYIIGGENADGGGNADIDWLEFSSATSRP